MRKDFTLDTNSRGALHEMKAVIHLMEQGYQVFTNIKGTGPADMVAWCPKTNETLVIDVKTVRIYLKADGTKQYQSSLGTEKNKKQFVKYLGYCPDEDTWMWL